MNGYTKIITAVLLFSLGPLLVRLIDLDAISILFCASLIAVIFLLLKLFLQKRTKEIFKINKGTLLLILLGLFTTVNNSLFNTAIKTTTISNATLTHYMAPVFLVIFAAIFIKEKIRKISIIAMIISFLGLLIILSPNEITISNAHFLGLLLGTLSAVFFAVESLLKKILRKIYKADIIVIRYLIISVILLIPFVSFSRILSLNTINIFALLILGAVIIGGGSTLLTSGLKHVKAQHFAVISYLEPLGAIIWGFLIISEIPAVETLIGGVLILIGTYLAIRNKEHNKNQAKPI